MSRIKLSEKERNILLCSQLDAKAPTSLIRSKTGYRDHSIRYALQRALERDLLKRRCFVNLCRFGFTQYEIYFSLSSEKKYSRDEVLEIFLNSEKISWVGELGGEYRYGLNICVRNICEVADFFNHLSQKFGLLFQEKAVAARLSLRYFGNKYLSKEKFHDSYLSYEATERTSEFDETDHRILTGLMEVDHSSHRDLARKTGLPFSTLEYRIKRLELNKIICGYYYQINSQLLGVQSFLLLVNVKGFTEKMRKRFVLFCKEHPNIVVLIEAIGNWDFELEVEVEDSREIRTLTQELHDSFGTYIQSIKVLPSFGYPKVREYPFLDFSKASGISQP